MNDEQNGVAKLFVTFEDCKFSHDGAEAWRARHLMALLGYDKWERFRGAIKRAWESCASIGVDPTCNFICDDGSGKAWSPTEVFPGAGKNPLGGRPSENVILTRRAAYLVAMNGDPRKPAVAFAQHYFAAKTRTLEVIEQRLAESGRLDARQKLTKTESKFQGVLYEHDVDGDGIKRIRSQGDEVLFGGHDTADMKVKWGCPTKRPLADFAPEVAIVAKQLATAMTTHNVKARKLRGEGAINVEHIANNTTVRSGLKDRDIILEQLGGEEDLKKIERRHASEAKKLISPPKREAKQSNVTGGEAGKKPSKKKKPTAKNMVKWFQSNHARAVEVSPFNSEEGGYTYPLADVIDVLSDQFPDATSELLAKAEIELDDGGPWVTMEVTATLQSDRSQERA